MRTGILTLALPLVLAGTAEAQSAPPSTDIYLAPLTVAGGRVSVGTPVNVTSRRGYDNQPSFTADGASILYTSVRDDGQADIWRYDLADRSTHQVTRTPESEYSPTVMPGGKRFSVVRVEKDSTQRLWSFALDGTDPELVLDRIKPVGYHAWADDSTVVLFVLGKPNTLQIANIHTGATETRARDIGRSLQTVPGRQSVSFLQHQPDSTWALRILSFGNPAAAGGVMNLKLADMPRGSEFVAWLPNGTAIAGEGGRLYTLPDGGRQWIPVADLSGAGIAHISRLAVSPDGRWLALVADDPPSR